jgi:hypothetical protein
MERKEHKIGEDQSRMNVLGKSENIGEDHGKMTEDTENWRDQSIKFNRIPAQYWTGGLQNRQENEKKFFSLLQNTCISHKGQNSAKEDDRILYKA